MSGHDFHWCRVDGAGRTRSTGDGAATYPWWSFTKTVIAICALRLVEDGHLHLDAPLTGRAYTLRHLLGHTAGLPDYGRVAAYHEAVARHEAPWPRAKLLEAARADQPLFAPGAGWAYSNIGYMFAREIIEDCAGKGLADIVAKMICAPLGLNSVRLAQSRAEFSRLHWQAAADYDPGWVYHGCLTGGARDAALLLHALFGGKLLRAATLRDMLARHPLGGPIPGRIWLTAGYALGLMSGEMPDVGRAIGHSGRGPTSTNAVYHFPDLRNPVTVACFTDAPDEGIAEAEAVRVARLRGL